MVKSQIFKAFAVIAVFSLFSNTVMAVEILRWDRTPLRIALPVGEERIIEMDRNMRIGLPRAIANSDVLRVQSAGGVLYLKAHESFDIERVRLQDIETGEVILFDLYADKAASSEPVKIVYDTPARQSSKTPSSVASSSRSAGNAASSSSASASVAERVSEALTGNTAATRPRLPAPIVLTRYAAQSLYAPLRTIEEVPGITRSPMRLPTVVTTLLPGYPVEVTPIAGWQYQGYEVTAFQIKNKDAQRAFRLDPRHLQGRFYSATFMHESIHEAGHFDDSTTLFLVTQGSISAALIGGGAL